MPATAPLRTAHLAVVDQLSLHRMQNSWCLTLRSGWDAVKDEPSDHLEASAVVAMIESYESDAGMCS